MSHETPTPDISVVMPVFNCEPFLEHQLKALLACTTVNIEIIAVDDGSSDRSLLILRACSARDARLRVIAQTNQGPGAARNAALDVARGTWVAFVDADDMLDATALEQWVAQARSEIVDVLIGNGYRFASESDAVQRIPILSKQPNHSVVNGHTWIEHCVTLGEWPHYVWLQLIRRDLIEAHGLRFDPFILHEDILWTMDLALIAHRIGFAQNPVYGYRRNPDSIVSSVSPQRRHLRATSYLQIIERLLRTSNRYDLARTTQNALKQHALHETLHLIDLLRKEIDDPVVRRDIAQKLLALRVFRQVFSCIRTPKHVVRLCKAYRRIKKMAM